MRTVRARRAPSPDFRRRQVGLLANRWAGLGIHWHINHDLRRTFHHHQSLDAAVARSAT
jgi:hypothetical protein